MAFHLAQTRCLRFGRSLDSLIQGCRTALRLWLSPFVNAASLGRKTEVPALISPAQRQIVERLEL